MTLVAAYRSSEGGILLCADREEDDGYAKRSVNKIYPIRMIPCQIFIAGAGPSTAIARANMEIHNALTQAFSDGKKDVRQEYRSIIESALQSVHKQFKSVLRDWSMNLLIVVSLNVENAAPLLYQMDQSVMVPEDFYIAHGTGKLIADYFSDRLYEYPRLDKPNLGK